MIAGCERIPPESVTSAPTFANRIDHTGDVIGQTSTSPGWMRSNCSSPVITRAVPEYEPRAAAMPLSSRAPASARLLLSSGSKTLLVA